jgi:hypothetical protein
VRISGRINVEATESAATKLAVDIIFGLLRWENLNTNNNMVVAQCSSSRRVQHTIPSKGEHDKLQRSQKRRTCVRDRLMN